MHTERTQLAQRTHIHLNTDTTQRKQNTRYNNMQHIHINTEQENTEQHTETETNNHSQDNTYTSTENSAHNYRTYSLDYYFEYAYINNSDTIELYTISKD